MTYDNEIQGFFNTQQPTNNTISRKEFEAFEKVRESGKTNMHNVHRVVEYSNGILNSTTVADIMRHYKHLCEVFEKPKNQDININELDQLGAYRQLKKIFTKDELIFDEENNIIKGKKIKIDLNENLLFCGEDIIKLGSRINTKLLEQINSGL